MKTSEHLVVGQVYTRAKLQKQFHISDATIRTGIFRPSGHDSIWLFITEKKSPDRTQYRDELAGDDLYMDGQTSGRTDHLIVGHVAQDLELLTFYRHERYEHPGGGFRYEGSFRYVSREGSGPAHFHLRRVIGNGSVDREIVQAAAQIRARSGGQGISISPAARQAIDRHAMKEASAYYADAGYAVYDVSKTEAYDLRCKRDDKVLHVEVKGTQTAGDEILLTPGEVRLAREKSPNTVLFVLSSVMVTEVDGIATACGGTVRVLFPWNPEDSMLKPLGFTCSLPKQ